MLILKNIGYGLRCYGFILAIIFLDVTFSAAESLALNRQTPVFVPGQTRVHQTAAVELAAALSVKPEELKITGSADVKPGSIFVGMIGELPASSDLILNGKINLHNIPPEIDAFEIIRSGEVLWLLGSNPRGVLQAVYTLHEAIKSGETIGEDYHRHGEFAIPRRIFHQRFDSWPGERADVRYISHLGATHCLVAHDWDGEHRHFSCYVPSDIFPKAVDSKTVENGHRELRALIDNGRDYGLEAALWITELPCQGGPWVPDPQRQEFLARYPADVLSDCGTYQGKVLCFGHPMVQDYYRQLEQRFFREFPEVTLLFVFGMDSGGEFCDPQQCPRCKGMSKFEQRDRFVRFLLDEGRKVQPNLTVLTTTWGWEGVGAQEFVDRQRQMPAGVGVFMAAQCDGWQPERQDHQYFRQIRGVCQNQNQLFIGYDDLHWGDDSVHHLGDIQDYPLGVGAKIKRWNRMAVDGVFDHWGTWSEDVSCNSIACREFFLNPAANPETVCREIALKQFGQTAGDKVFQSWRQLEQAHQILSNACTWPPSQWPGWYDGRDYPPLPADFAKNPLGLGLIEKPAWGQVYNAGDLAQRCHAVGQAWRLAWPHYKQATEMMQQAIDSADDSLLFYAFWWSGDAKSPSRREHLNRQKLYQESMGLVGREIGLHFGLRALYLQTAGDDSKYRLAAESVLREDSQACRAASAFFKQLIPPNKPNDWQKEWAEKYSAKADAINAYLKISNPKGTAQ